MAEIESRCIGVTFDEAVEFFLSAAVVHDRNGDELDVLEIVIAEALDDGNRFIQRVGSVLVLRVVLREKRRACEKEHNAEKAARKFHLSYSRYQRKFFGYIEKTCFNLK